MKKYLVQYGGGLFVKGKIIQARNEEQAVKALIEADGIFTTDLEGELVVFPLEAYKKYKIDSSHKIIPIK